MASQCFRLIALALLLIGCAPTLRPTVDGPAGPGGDGYRVEDIVDLAGGGVISFAALTDRVLDQDVVYLGETHTSPEDHRFQEKLITALCRRLGSVRVAMEMFARSEQEVLDQWSSGRLDEQDFIERSRWAEQWGYPFELYRGLLDLVRQRQLPLIALNLPSALMGKIAQSGLAGLDPEQRRFVAGDLDFTNTGHRQQMEREFAVHPWGGIRNFETFYEAQLAWEETMAERLAEALRAGDRSASGPIVVIVGKGHVQGRFGLPERTRRRVPHRYLVVTSLPIETLEADPPGSELADFARIEESQTVPRHGHRGLLGVMLEPAEDGHGFRVVRLAPSGAGAAAGLRPGDRLLWVDAVPITRLEDLRRQLENSAGYHALLIRRGQQLLTVPVRIGQKED